MLIVVSIGGLSGLRLVTESLEDVGLGTSHPPSIHVGVLVLTSASHDDGTRYIIVYFHLRYTSNPAS